MPIMHLDNPIIRFSEPSKMDHAPQGYTCRVMKNETDYDLYLQSSSQEDDPKWIHMGDFCTDTIQEENSSSSS